MSDDEQSRQGEEIKKGVENPTYMDLPEPEESTTQSDESTNDNNQSDGEKEESG